MKPKIGLQLWSIQEACKEDLFQALESVKKSGYDGVEFAGYYGYSATEVANALKEYDLGVAASHLPLKHCGIILKQHWPMKKRSGITDSWFHMLHLRHSQNGNSLPESLQKLLRKQLLRALNATITIMPMNLPRFLINQ